MGVRKKVAVSILLIIIVALAVWQFSSPQLLPPVGNKYSTFGPYSNRGSWTFPETLQYGRAYFTISISNVTFPRAGIGTDYSLVISDVNQTITNSIVKGFGVRVTGMSIQDSVDGSTSTWGNGNAVSDAVQATSVFFFRASTDHMLRFTVTFQVYNLLPLGSIPDQTVTSSFNITQRVL
ncbi:MAG TPA: hypothetical protein VNA15_01020 [Candidatus Angelobacter sp.]|nr:hypothetical protein [Candidatus Angelobacter sp.]